MNTITGRLRAISKLVARLSRALFAPGLSVQSHWIIGNAYYLRTVTHIITGRLRAISKTEVVVDEAAWIADTGRYADAMASGEFAEVEPYPANWKVTVNRAALIDAAQWPHALPSEQK